MTFLIATLLVMTLVVGVSAIQCDYVNIGVPSNETGHDLQDGWGPVENATHGGNWGGKDDGTIRVVWYNPTTNPIQGIPTDPLPDGNPDSRSGSLMLYRDGCYDAPLTLYIRALDGTADDSFIVTIDVIGESGTNTFSYTAQGSSNGETWITHEFDLDPSLWGDTSFRVIITATGDKWKYFDTYGQLGISWVSLEGTDAEIDSEILKFTEVSSSSKEVICAEPAMTYLNYNENIVTHGFSSTDTGEILTNGISPQYIWDDIIDKWQPVSSQNSGSAVNWNSYLGFQWGPLNDGLHRVCARAKDTEGNLENSWVMNVWDAPDDDCCDVCVDTSVPESVEDLIHISVTARTWHVDWEEGTDWNDGEFGVSEPVHYDDDWGVDFNWSKAEDTPKCSGVDYYNLEVKNNSETTIDSGSTPNLWWRFDSKNHLVDNGNDNGYDGSNFNEKFDGCYGNFGARIQAVDLAGNEGVWSEWTDWVFVDLCPPSVDLTGPDGWQTDDFAVHIEASDAETSVDFCQVKILDNGIESLAWTTVPCNADYTVDVSEYCITQGEEACEVQARAIDMSGNVGGDSEKFDIDTILPETTKTVGDPRMDWSYTPEWTNWDEQSWFINSSTIITLNCADSGSGPSYINYSVDGIWNQVFEGSTTFSVTGTDGMHIITYYCVDVAGWVEDEKAEPDYLDNTKPTTTKEVGEPKYEYYPEELPECNWYEESWYVSHETVFDFICDDGEGSGCAEGTPSVSYWQGCACEGQFNLVDFEDLGDGQFTVMYYSVDNLDNEEEHIFECDFMDNTGPTVTIINPSITEIGCEGLEFSVKVYVNDEASGVDTDSVYAELINSEEEIVDTAILTWKYGDVWGGIIGNEHPAGIYTLKVYAFDNVDNQGEDSTELDLILDVFYTVIPSECVVTAGEEETCDFNYHLYLCHGGNAVGMQMEKWGMSCSYPGHILYPTLTYLTETVLVTESGEEWYSLTPESWLVLERLAPKSASGFHLQFNAPDSIINCDTLKYWIGYGFNDDFPIGSREETFSVSSHGNKVTFEPNGPIGGFCGNGVLEWDEQCDGNSFGGLTCEAFGFDYGTLSCTDTCLIDYSGCKNSVPPIAQYCGDNSCNNGETCETCPEDCGVCSVSTPQATSSGGGGGGGGSPRTAEDTTPTFLEENPFMEEETGLEQGTEDDNTGITGSVIGNLLKKNLFPIIAGVLIALIIATSIVAVAKKKSKKKEK